MNNELLMDAISCLDSDLLAEHLKRKEELSRKTKRSLIPVILKWSAIAASLVLTVTSVFLISEQLFKAPPDDLPISTDQPTDNNATLPIVTDKPTDNNTSRPTESSGITGEPLDLPAIWLDNRFYIPEIDLSEQATEENVGEFLGLAFLGGDVDKELSAFEYLPKDEKKSRIIVPYDDKFYVCVFWMYDMKDESKEYPAVLLESAVDVGIDDGLLDPSLMTDVNYINFADVDDAEGFIDFLKRLTENEKYDPEYMNDYIFGGGKPTKNRRYIRVTLEDKTYFEYEYIVGTGTLTFGDGGYILTEEQNEELLSLMGMD